ncbi:21 kDa protein-like [Punica granatum]|uniref:21 kDa protein-like n=1 Tax=Punica granatum TaxID=22663 RepID=A0A6P8CC56_PUNGR|nr:21 kDa protein-like [Punica granatum]
MLARNPTSSIDHLRIRDGIFHMHFETLLRPRSLLCYPSCAFPISGQCLGARISPRLSPSTEFIKSSCGATMYPDICYQTLSSYASTIQTSPTEMASTTNNIVAMKDLGGPEFEMQMGNIQTRVSAALTDEDTCMDGIEGRAFNGEVKRTIKSRIVRVAQLTSNALALINRLQSK